MSQLVRLKYGESETFAPGGGIGNVETTKITSKVANVAFQKSVILHYQQSDGTWADRPLQWQGNFGDYDLFGGNFNDFATAQFVIRYDVNGQTFWDKNGSANYHVDSGHPNVVADRQLILNQAVARRGTEAGGGFVFTTSWVEGEIYVQNLSFNKRVGIRLTANGWTSSHDTDASYGGAVPVATGTSGVEKWEFKTPEYNLDLTTPDFRFAVYYEDLDTGEWFWDNDFGHDYVLGKADGTTVD